MHCPPEHRALLEAAAASGRERGVRFVATVLPAPRGAGLRLLESQLSPFSCYWSPRRADTVAEPQLTMVGVGCAIQHRMEGALRFDEAQHRMAASFREVFVPEELKSVVRFFGGAAFSAGRDGSGSCWSDFGDASFFLPRVLYVDEDPGARLVVLVEPRRLDETTQALKAIYAQFEQQATIPGEPLFAVTKTESSDEATWVELLGGIKELLRQGTVRKVVAARRVTVQLSREPALAEVVQRFDAIAPVCTHFALRLGEKTFLGATPELLVEKCGPLLRTEALAGSISRDHPDAEAALRESAKDQAEHAFVVDAIRAQLSEICDQIEVPDRPEVQRLLRILHLRTPISARLAEPTHVLAVVQRLHPTPAVGGVPRHEAIEWITHNEPTERGWYASPFGWVDSEGNGQFVVALRSALLHGDKVHAYAGAGIVEQSDARLEFAETELKLTSMLGALGVGA